MGREQIVDRAADERVDDEEMRGGGNTLGTFHRYAAGGLVDAGEGGGEPCRVPDDLGADAVGVVLARAGDRHLNEHGGERREDRGRDYAEDVAAAVAAAEQHRELEHVGHHGDRAADRRRDGHDEGVAVPDMGEFVRHNGRHLLAREHFEQAG